MKLKELFESSTGRVSRTKISKLLTTHLCLSMFEGEQLYIIADIPKTITDQQYEYLMSRSFTEAELKVLHEMDSFIPIRENGNPNLADIQRECSLTEDDELKSVFAIWEWKHLIEEERENMKQLYDASDFEDDRT